MELMIFSLTLMVGYLIYVRLRFGMTHSISATYYEIKNKWLFTIVLWGFSIPLMIVSAKPLMFLAGAAICFTGAAPGVDKKMERRVHVGSSVAGIAIGTIALWVYYGLWWVVGIQLAFTGIAMIFQTKYHTYFIELLAVILIWASIYLNEVV